MQYEVKMAALGLEEIKAHLADSGSARDHQWCVQESSNASWLTKNAAFYVGSSQGSKDNQRSLNSIATVMA